VTRGKLIPIYTEGTSLVVPQMTTRGRKKGQSTSFTPRWSTDTIPPHANWHSGDVTYNHRQPFTQPSSNPGTKVMGKSLWSERDTRIREETKSVKSPGRKYGGGGTTGKRKNDREISRL